LDLAENRSFSGSGRPRGPRDPLRSTGPAPHSNLHKKSAPETNSKAISRGFCRGGFGIWLKIGRFRGLGGPGGLKNYRKKGGGLRPPPLWMVLRPPGAAQTPKTTDFQPNPKPPSAKPPCGNRRWFLSEPGTGPARCPPKKPSVPRGGLAPSPSTPPPGSFKRTPGSFKRSSSSLLVVGASSRGVLHDLQRVSFVRSLLAQGLFRYSRSAARTNRAKQRARCHFWSRGAAAAPSYYKSGSAALRSFFCCCCRFSYRYVIVSLNTSVQKNKR